MPTALSNRAIAIARDINIISNSMMQRFDYCHAIGGHEVRVTIVKLEHRALGIIERDEVPAGERNDEVGAIVPSGGIVYDELRQWAKPHAGPGKASPGHTCHHEQASGEPDPRQNRLLASLAGADYQALAPALEHVSLPLGHVLREEGVPIRHIYFPTDCVVAILHVLETGATTESALIGNEGMVGTPLILGSATATSRAAVVSAGRACRLSGSVLKREFERGGALQHLLLRFTQALITQQAQTAACNRHHSIEQQLCRWLLLCLDRRPSARLAVTQELIATMLGERREGITEAAGRLQARGVIEHRRGHIAVIDRAKLEASACECYAVVRRECERMLPTRPAQSACVRAVAPSAPSLGVVPQAVSTPRCPG